MKKLQLLFVLVTSSVALSGCGMVGVSTNIPLFRSKNVVEVINASSHEVTITINGEVVEAKLLPGDSIPIRIYNFDSYAGSILVTAKAWDRSDFIGATSRTFSIGYQNAESWKLTDRSFKGESFWDW